MATGSVPSGRGGCLPWCSQYTCEEPDCNGCGKEHGCSRYVKPGSVKACATFCNEYTCMLDACSQCSKADAGCEGREPTAPSPPPHPSWPPLPKLSFGEWLPSEFYTYGSSIYTNAWGEDGQPSRLRIKGAAWFGLESGACHIGGSDRRSLASVAAWLKQQGFNAVRIPFAADAVVTPRHKCLENGNMGGIREQNPQLLVMSYVQQIQEVVKVAGNAGLLVLLDAHVVNAGVWPDGGKVDKTGRTILTNAWQTLAEALCDPERYWNVIGADLKNEPYSMFWGTPPAALMNVGNGYSEDDRWDTLATDLGSLVHRACPRWLSFVQGVGHCMSNDPGPCRLPSAPGIQDMDISTWWGENLQAAEHSKVNVGERRRGVGKTVASPHTYGPSTYQQPQFNTSLWPNYPDNLPKLWSTQWAYLATQGVMPVVVGEFGGRCVGADEAFQKRLVQFLSSQSIGAFYWSLNPESRDTGGLITDWTTFHANEGKLRVLEGLRATKVPTTMERLHASSLFSVSALPPPAPMPSASPLPHPPPPIPPPDTTFDFLFSGDVGGATKASSKERFASEPHYVEPTSAPAGRHTPSNAPSTTLHASVNRINGASSGGRDSSASVVHGSSVAVAATLPAQVPVSYELQQSVGESFGVPKPSEQALHALLPFGMVIIGVPIVALAVLLSMARGVFCTPRASQRRERIPTVDPDDLDGPGDTRVSSYADYVEEELVVEADVAASKDHIMRI